jgi:hypothetical protein
VYEVDDKTHKLELQLAREGVEPVTFMVPTHDVVHCALDLNLTKINIVGREIVWKPKRT